MLKLLVAASQSLVINCCNQTITLIEPWELEFTVNECNQDVATQISSPSPLYVWLLYGFLSPTFHQLLTCPSCSRKAAELFV